MELPKNYTKEEAVEHAMKFFAKTLDNRKSGVITSDTLKSVITTCVETGYILAERKYQELYKTYLNDKI